MIPKHLQHKPIIAVDNYRMIDGHFLPNRTDAEALSLGYAQFAPNDLSAKIFRCNNGQWSRQSEELPLHRCVDLCNLIVQSIMKTEGINYNHISPAITPQIEDAKGLDDIRKFYANSSNNHLRDKLRELRTLIDILNP